MLFGGAHAEVWIREGEEPTQGAVQRSRGLFLPLDMIAQLCPHARFSHTTFRPLVVHSIFCTRFRSCADVALHDVWVVVALDVVRNFGVLTRLHSGLLCRQDLP
jgi:hypothetical protein